MTVGDVIKNLPKEQQNVIDYMLNTKQDRVFVILRY